MTEVSRGVANTTDTAPLHETPSPKKTSAAPKSRKTPVDPKNPKQSPAKLAEGKHTHEERKYDRVKLGKGDAKITFRGGPRDGQTSSIDGHEHPFVVDDAGDMYVRKDEQEGDFRVYQYTIADGEPFPVSIVDGPVAHNTLQHDMDVLHRERKRQGPKQPKVTAD